MHHSERARGKEATTERQGKGGGGEGGVNERVSERADTDRKGGLTIEGERKRKEGGGGVTISAFNSNTLATH